jgi:predicted metal-dependent enzyme (double-stranded beta helix superfamily)
MAARAIGQAEQSATTFPVLSGRGDLGGRRHARHRLSPAQLGRLVSATATARAQWEPIAQFNPERRWFQRLALANDYEVWLLTWLPGQHTGFHDHGSAAGAFAVARGELWETLAAMGSTRITPRPAAAGAVTAFGGRHLHDVANVSDAPAVSVHAYSPPLVAMRRYEMTPAGLAHVRTDRAELDW